MYISLSKQNQWRQQNNIILVDNVCKVCPPLQWDWPKQITKKQLFVSLSTHKFPKWTYKLQTITYNLIGSILLKGGLTSHTQVDTTK